MDTSSLTIRNVLLNREVQLLFVGIAFLSTFLYWPFESGVSGHLDIMGPRIYWVLTELIGFDQGMAALFYLGLIACVMRSSRLMVVGVLCLISSALYFTFSPTYVSAVAIYWIAIIPLGAIAYLRYNKDHAR